MALNIPMMGNLGGVASSVLNIVIIAVVGVVALIFLIFLIKLWKKKKEFNIPVTIWIPRSDNKIIDEITAKGGYVKSKAVGGITSFKIVRKGVSTVEIPPPESKFLVGLSRHLYLVQKGVDDYEPVLPESFMTVETDRTFKWKNPKTGKLEIRNIRKAVVNLKAKNQDATAWAFDNEENAKRRFTFHGLWEKYKDFIQITIFILIVFIAATIQWKGLGEVATQLENVANILRPAIDAAPVVS